MLYLPGDASGWRSKAADGGALWPCILFALHKVSPGLFVRVTGSIRQQEEPMPLQGHVSHLPSTNEVQGSESYKQL